jgi:DNA-binding transcriptional regulator YiaG
MVLNAVTIGSKIPVVKPNELIEFRERLGLSQTELAKELRVARNTVWRWENGERLPPEFLDLALETVERNLAKKDRVDN